MNAIKPVSTQKRITWKDRLLGMTINETMPVAVDNASVVRAEISRLRQVEAELKFTTWTDNIGGTSLVVVKRIA